MFKHARIPLQAAAMLIVTTPASSPVHDPSAPLPAHHNPGKGFVNPWPSFKQESGFKSILGPWYVYRDWVSRPVPPAELLPRIVKPQFEPALDVTEKEKEEWRDQIKSTWLGHACFLVEFPAVPGGNARGARVLFDPVFSKRCSPSQIVGPARVTPPPIPLNELPEVDIVVLSHNHYDHTDVTTLKHIFETQAKNTVHFFAPVGNLKWFKSLGFDAEHVTELDWWEERNVEVPLVDGKTNLLVTCTPCQHFTGRSLTDRNETLWASWAVAQLPSALSTKAGNVWFGGDTGFKSVPRGATTEEGLPTCPVFKEIGERKGPFDFSMIPIGAYDPRHFMSRIHCSPEDAVELHLDVKSKRSIGMHWATWVLTCEEMTEPPKRLSSACVARGIAQKDFSVCDIGETLLTPVTEDA